MVLSKVDEIIDGYGADKSWLVMILQDVQEALNYLPAPALNHVAERLGVGLNQVYNVATFYSSFSLRQRGKHIIRVCDGTACHLRGSVGLREEITRQLGVEKGQTTPDKLFTLETVACLGACALSPVMTIGSKYYAKLTPARVKAVLGSYGKKKQTDP